MKTKNLAMILLGSALSFSPLNLSKNQIQEQIIWESEPLKLPLKKQDKNYILCPFRTTYCSVPKINNKAVNKNATKFLENTLIAARKKYENEALAYEKYSFLKKEFLNAVSYINYSPENQRFHLSFLESLKTENNKKTIDLKKLRDEKLEKFKKKYSKELKEFYKKVGFYGRWIATEDSPYYNKKRMKELDSYGMQRTDCISYLLMSMKEGNFGYFMYPYYTSPEGFGELMNELNFESIYIAQNTISRDSVYRYNTEGTKGSLTNDFIRKIKKGLYPIAIDYLVTDSLFNTPNFQKFINETSGFLIIQEGRHTAFLDKGEILEACIFADPFYIKTFGRVNFWKNFDNDKPDSDYQSCVLFVPKGTVNSFMKKIYSEKNKNSDSTKTF